MNSKTLPHILFLIIFVMFFTPAVFSLSNVEFSGYAKASMKGSKMGVAYVQIKNNTNKKLIFKKASTSQANVTEIHTHIKKNDMLKMVQLKEIEVPAQGQFKMSPGHAHLMLFELNKPLLKNENLEMQFEDENKVVFKFKVPIK